MAVLTIGIFLLSLAPQAHGYLFEPAQGFFMVANLPSVERSNGISYVYAIDTNVVLRSGQIEISKDGLDRSAVKEGEIWADELQWGCYIAIAPPKMALPTRFGVYTGTWTSDESPPAIETSYTFVRPNSKFLDTDGVYTLTVYPTAFMSTTLAEKNSIGVRRVGCTRYTWFKDGKKLKHTSARLPITCTEDGGLYTVSRAGSSRRSRGWCVQIRVIVATCPEGMYVFDDGEAEPSCMGGLDCKNGGVLKDNRSKCLCNPYFGSSTCGCVVPSPEDDPFILGDALSDQELYCKDLPGGNPRCRGMLFCFGNLYGCKCAPGWRGNRCDRPCSKGRWGSNCELACPENESDCNRFVGPNLICDD